MRFRPWDEGQDLIEYALALVLVVIVVYLVYLLLGPNLPEVITEIEGYLDSALNR